MTHPDDHQVGGDHYRKVSGEQHWTRIYRLFGPGYFIGCITKYVERYKEKGGKQVKRYMNKSVRASLILATLVVVSVLATLWAMMKGPFPYISPFERRRPPAFILWDIELFYIVQTVVSTINVTLLIILLATYVGIYIKTKSEFTIGLIIFSTIMLLNSLVSNPFLHLVFGFREFGLGPFAMLPDLFTLAALAVLLYFTFKY